MTVGSDRQGIVQIVDPPNWLLPNNLPGVENTEKLFYKQLALGRVIVPRRSSPCSLPHTKFPE